MTADDCGRLCTALRFNPGPKLRRTARPALPLLSRLGRLSDPSAMAPPRIPSSPIAATAAATHDRCGDPTHTLPRHSSEPLPRAPPSRPASTMASTLATQLTCSRHAAFRPAAARQCRRGAAVVVRAQQQPCGLDRRQALAGLAAAVLAVQAGPALADGGKHAGGGCVGVSRGWLARRPPPPLPHLLRLPRVCGLPPLQGWRRSMGRPPRPPATAATAGGRRTKRTTVRRPAAALGGPPSLPAAAQPLAGGAHRAQPCARLPALAAVPLQPSTFLSTRLAGRARL